MARKIGSVLRRLRKERGLSADKVSEHLLGLGINVTVKTLYAYESDSRAIGVDAFLALCSFYGCKNILPLFGDIDVDYTIPSDEDLGLGKIAECYYKLNKEGREKLAGYADDLVSSRKYIKSHTDRMVQGA